MWDLDSTFTAFSRAFEPIAQLGEKFVVGFPKLQSVETVTRLSRHLDRRDLPVNFCHAYQPTLIVYSVHIGLCFVNSFPVFFPYTFGKPRGYGREGAASLNSRTMNNTLRRTRLDNRIAGTAEHPKPWLAAKNLEAHIGGVTLPG